MQSLQLEILKSFLQIKTDKIDTQLIILLKSAKAQIEIEGIKLEETVSDNTLVADYAAYLYRAKNEDKGMPRHLRYALNNRLFSQKGKV